MAVRRPTAPLQTVRRPTARRPTAQLLRGLRVALASQPAALPASRLWVRGLRRVCEALDGKVAAAAAGDAAAAVEGLATGWEELLAMADAAMAEA